MLCACLMWPASLSLQTFSWGLLAAVTSDGTAALILDVHLCKGLKVGQGFRVT